MSRWLYEFWHDVADPSWPAVEFWPEFVSLDPKIKTECYVQHSLAQRLSELDDIQQWQCRNLVGGFQLYHKDDFVFVNVPKCGSQHYQKFFLEHLGWQVITPRDLKDFDRYKLFGLMMDPYRRYLKGVTEFLWLAQRQQNIDLDFTSLNLLFPDAHSLPISLVMGPIMQQVAWIPLDIVPQDSAKQIMNNFFQKHKSKISVPLSYPAEHVSPPQKQALFNRVKQHFLSHEVTQTYASLMHQFLIPDAIFYRTLVDKFTPDWQHLD